MGDFYKTDLKLDVIILNQEKIMRNQDKLSFMLKSLDFVGGPMKEIEMETNERINSENAGTV
jgi:hypothetical protein